MPEGQRWPGWRKGDNGSPSVREVIQGARHQDMGGRQGVPVGVGGGIEAGVGNSIDLHGGSWGFDQAGLEPDVVAAAVADDADEARGESSGLGQEAPAMLLGAYRTEVVA